mmetsp:Transcript_12497/g.35503  ORF Transcript_12497/g.35503 Transcript_12497/m.35503 type:complete len:90 (+) Transcript_12497:237-506(+)
MVCCNPKACQFSRSASRFLLRTPKSQWKSDCDTGIRIGNTSFLERHPSNSFEQRNAMRGEVESSKNSRNGAQRAARTVSVLPELFPRDH